MSKIRNSTISEMLIRRGDNYQAKVKAFSEQVMPLLEDYLPGAQL